MKRSMERVMVTMLILMLLVTTSVLGSEEVEEVCLIESLSFSPGFWHLDFEADTYVYTVRIGDYMPTFQILEVYVPDLEEEVDVTINGIPLEIDQTYSEDGLVKLLSPQIDIALGRNTWVVEACSGEESVVYVFFAYYMSSSSNTVKDPGDFKHLSDKKGVDYTSEAPAYNQGSRNVDSDGLHMGSAILEGKEPPTDKEAKTGSDEEAKKSCYGKKDR